MPAAQKTRARGGSQTKNQRAEATTTTVTSSQFITEERQEVERILQTPVIEGGNSSAEVSSGLLGSPLSRQQEKEELKTLNNRLAHYIGTIRAQEQEIVTLRRKVETYTVNEEEQVKKVAEVYEAEIAKLRRALDEISKERAEAVTEADTMKAQMREQNSKIQSLDRETKNSQKKARDAETALKRLQNEYDAYKLEARDFEDTIRDQQKRISDLEPQLEALRKELQDETVSRVDAQNRLLSAQEELKFQKDLHSKRLSVVQKEQVTEVTEVDSRLKDEYDRRLAEELENLREEMEEMTYEARLELEDRYKTRMEELQNMVDRTNNELAVALEQLRAAQRRLSDAQKASDKERDEARATIGRLEADSRKKDKEIDQLQDALAELQEETQRLNAKINDQLIQYDELWDEKVHMTGELATYNAMLRAEEARVGIAPSPFPSTPSPTRGSQSVGRGVKRTRSFASRASFRNEATATGEVHIGEIDKDGQFVRLENKSDQDVGVGGWNLLMKASNGTNEETYYKFHANSNIAAGSAVTIWSQNSNVVHNPPTDLVMEGRWLVGDNTSLILANADGKEVARRVMAQSIERGSPTGIRKRRRSIGRDLPDSGADQKNCVIM